MRILDCRGCSTIKELNDLIDRTSLANPVFYMKYIPDKLVISEKMKDAIRQQYKLSDDDPLEFRTIVCEVRS